MRPEGQGEGQGTGATGCCRWENQWAAPGAVAVAPGLIIAAPGKGLQGRCARCGSEWQSRHATKRNHA